MTKSTIARERLAKIKSWRETYGAGSNVMLPAEEAEALALIALAAMDSEPVALKPELAKVIYHFRDWNEGFPVERFKADCVISWMLANYPPAQPAPVVPQDVLEALQKVARIRLDMNDFDGDRRGIADCLGDAEEALIEVVNRRAAMLHASPVCTCPSGDGSLRWPCPVHPGSSPAIPDGYVMVPKEPTAQMYHAGDRQMTTKQVWDAMLAAAPQEVKGE
ncbi:hypothetical protein [Klebsiella variicola]|uniref:hypothetical protein n=1 Tax=Klebsiella variicola TaxID=244366 RepID=UPI003D0819CB